MKKIIILSFIFLVLTGIVFCQATQEQSLTQTDYWNKSKKQKKTARILLIGGGALIMSSFIIPKGELVSDGFCSGAWWCDDEYKNDNLKGAVFIAGALAALGSIPFSIASSKNRKRTKNATVFIDVEKYPALNALLLRNQSFPVVVFNLT